MVKRDLIDDLEFTSIQLVKYPHRRLKEELDYPGHIKVTVIRETRAVETQNKKRCHVHRFYFERFQISCIKKKFKKCMLN